MNKQMTTWYQNTHQRNNKILLIRKRLCKNVEVIQAEIVHVDHGDLYLCVMFLTVHDKLTCDDSPTWTK